MLAKLIKYDMKALSRYLVVIHVMLLAAAVLGRVFLVDGVFRGGFGPRTDSGAMREVADLIMGISIFLIIVLFMAACFGTLVLVGMYFYKNMFSDEAYLTHTLPVSRGQLLTAKTIAGSAWIFIDNILLIASIAILLLTGDMMDAAFDMEARVLGEMGFPDHIGYGGIILSILVLIVVGAAGNALMLYVSVTVGQLFSNHRALGAVVAYFCISTVVSLVSGLVGASIGLSASEAGDLTFLFGFCVKLFLGSAALEVALAVVFYIITLLLLRKKLNLS